MPSSKFAPLTNEQVEDLLIHAGPDGDPYTDSVNVPIYQTSTFRQHKVGGEPAWEYSRSGNPTRAALEKVMAQLENGLSGFAFASGMAAVSTALELLEPDAHVLISENVYGGTYRVLDGFFKRYGLTYATVDANNVDALDAALAAAGPHPALLLESPANPLLEVTDIARAAEVAHAHGVLVIVDNTFMSPYLQRPLELGADVVVHSATKYLGGHSDVIAGFVVVRDEGLAKKVAWLQNSLGAVPGPQDCFYLLRGIKTLGVRLDRQSDSAQKIAEFLADRPEAARVYYPGLADNPGHEVQLRQAKTAGAMVTFELAHNLDINTFMTSLKRFTLAESLGGVESLSCHPATMTHAAIPAPERKRMGITDQLVRLSVGLEPASVLVGDLGQAFARSAL